MVRFNNRSNNSNSNSENFHLFKAKACPTYSAEPRRGNKGKKVRAEKAEKAAVAGRAELAFQPFCANRFTSRAMTGVALAPPKPVAKGWNLKTRTVALV